MSYPRFLILTILSSVIALCVLLQIIFVRMVQADELRLKQTELMLQEGQNCYGRLQQIASRVAQVAQQQQDPALRDLLTRQNIQIKPNAGAPAAAAPAPAAPAPAMAPTH
jgi:hypothetical protein